MWHNNEKLQKLGSTLGDEQKCLNELNREQGVSSWLTTIPLSEEGYEDLILGSDPYQIWLETHKTTIQLRIRH